MSELIIKEVKYYVENDVTKEEVAKHFNRSISSVKKDFAKFKSFVMNNSDSEYYDLYLKELEKSKSNEQAGRMKGSKSTNSGRKNSLSEIETLEIAKYIIKNNATIRMAEEEFNVPRSTIYDSIEELKNSDDLEIELIYSLIHDVYNSNKSNATSNIYPECNTKVSDDGKNK